MGESSLNFRLLFWTDNFSEWIRIKSEVVFMVYDILTREGISIPFPQRDLHIKSIDSMVAPFKNGEKEEGRETLPKEPGREEENQEAKRQKS